MLSFPPTTYEKMAYVKAVLKKQAGIPDSLVHLTGSYLSLQSDFRLALQPLKFSGDGRVSNPRTYHAIREALISNFCDLLVKRQIFLNMTPDASGIYACVFNLMHQDIRDSGYLINLDFVDLSHLDLNGLNFDGMSLKYADFTASLIHDTSFLAADLRNAKFDDAHLRMVNLEMTELEDVTWTGATLTRVNLFGATNLDLCGIKEINQNCAPLEATPSGTTLNFTFERSDSSAASTASDGPPIPDGPCCCVVL